MRASLVSLVVLATLWSVSQARLIQFNTTWTSECAGVDGCNFLSDLIWEEGLIPEDGDDIHVIAESNVNLFLRSLNLTNIAITTHATTLHVVSSHINFTTVSLGGASTLALTSSPVTVQEWLYANSSTITVEQESELDLVLGSTTFYLDAASHIVVTDTSILSSSAQSWLWGNVTSTDSAVLVFYSEVTIAGPTSFESTEQLHLERVTFANHTVFPVGFTADYVTVSSLASVVVNGGALVIESLTTLNADSEFVVSSVPDAEFLSTTAAGSIIGEGVLRLSSSSVVIAPSGFHVDGNVTNFNGTIVFSGPNNLTLALFVINNDFDTSNDSDINLNVFGVHVASPLQFTGSITAGRFADNIPALTVLAPVHVTRCLTSIDGSLDIQSSFTCGADFPFSVSSALADSFRPFVNFTGNLDTLGVGTLQASSALFNNTVFLASEDYEIEGIDAVLDITFVDSEVSLAGTSLLYASHINFAGTNNVTLSESSSVDYTAAAVVGGTTTITQSGFSTISGSDAGATFTLEPSSSLHLNEDSNFNSNGYSEFHGAFSQTGASSVNLNNVAFRGPTVFNSTGALNFNGNVDLSGEKSLAFTDGINFASSLSLANGTSLEVWRTLNAAAPVYVAAGATLILRNCAARLLSNDTHPALWGEGALFVITSYLDTDVPPNTVNFYYADYQGPVTIGGISTLSLLLFSFNQITFTTGAADEPADVLLEAYGVRFNTAADWPGPAVLHPAVGVYPALEIHAPVSFTSVTSYSASLNLTNDLTSLYGPILFEHPDDFSSFFWTHNNSMIVAPQGLILQGTQFVAGPGTTSVHANVENLLGSIIVVSSATNLQIYGNYNGSESNILYTSINKEADAAAPINVTDTAYLAGTSAWYGVVIENNNDTLKESISNVAIFEAQSIQTPFAHVVAGLPTTENVTISSTVSAHEGRERVYINNDYTAPPSDDKPIYKKWWFWILIIAAICAILVGIAYYVRNRKRHMYTPLEM